MSTLGSVSGEIEIALLIDFFSKYSENFNTTSPPLNSVLPHSGFEEIKFGGVLSSGPPLGGAIAAHV